MCRSTCLPFIVCRYICICKYVCISITNPIQENGVKEEGEGQGEGAPDSSPQGQPDAVSPTPGLGEDDDDSLLEEGEVDMRAMMVAGGVMEFELLRLPPQSKTVGPWTFQQGGRGRRRGSQGSVHPCITPFSHMYTMCESCMQDVMCLH